MLLKRGTGNGERGTGGGGGGNEEQARGSGKLKLGTKQRIGNEVVNRARVQVRFCSFFFIYLFLVLVPRSSFPDYEISKKYTRKFCH